MLRFFLDEPLDDDWDFTDLLLLDELIEFESDGPDPDWLAF